MKIKIILFSICYNAWYVGTQYLLNLEIILIQMLTCHSPSEAHRCHHRTHS